MKIERNHFLSQETSFKCGGKASFYCEVEDIIEFCNLLKFHKGDLYILGNGSKTLCSDKGFDGLVISTKKLNNMVVCQESDKSPVLLECECGVKFDDLHKFCIKNELGGLEFLVGIPASVGGAVVMNAGAFGDETGNFVEKVEIFENNALKILDKSEINFSYRNSSLKNKFITKVWFRVAKSEKNDIINKQNHFLKKRSQSQPQGVANAGSIFKRKGDVIPSKIIDELGLKGLRVGGAEISTVHAGFIVNLGNATAEDVIQLINKVKERVLNERGIELENEIIIL